MIQIICTGGRDYQDRETAYKALNALKESLSCVHVGDARGADSIVQEWCIKNYVTLKVYEADWREYGRAAGPIRNSQMINSAIEYAAEEGERLYMIVFKGGKGTADAAKKFQRKTGKKPIHVDSLKKVG